MKQSRAQRATRPPKQSRSLHGKGLNKVVKTLTRPHKASKIIKQENIYISTWFRLLINNKHEPYVFFE